MKNEVFWGVIGILVILSMVLLSCSSETTSTSVTSSQSTTKSTAVTTTESTTAAPNTNWWDKLGEPKYGGTITMRITATSDLNFDNIAPPAIAGNWLLWFESLFTYDWTVDRDIWSFRTGFIPEKYIAGNLAETWDQPDPQTVVVHLHHGVLYQDKPPVNGRELTSEDIVYHYDRICGTGHGFTEPNPVYASFVGKFQSATATDKYTVTIKFKQANATNFDALSGVGQANLIEASEVVQQYGDLKDWKNAIGTGPWILTDFKDGSSLTYAKNPNYWGNDERYPENKLPYGDNLIALCIPDPSTAYAALRTGKIDLMTGIDWQQADLLIKGTPELLKSEVPTTSMSVLFNLNNAPFNDINVRKALQMSVDLKTIAQSYFGGVDPTPCGELSPALKGYAYSYDQWPQSLKDEYSYNPEGAKHLLTQAGFPTGFDTNIVTPTIADLTLLQVIKAYFTDIGVNMDVKTMDIGPFIALTHDKSYDQMAAAGFETGSTGVPWNAMLQLSPVSSVSTVSDLTFLAMLQSFDTITDPTELANQIMEADKYAIEQHWQVRLFPTVVYNIWQPYLKGYVGEAVSNPGYYARWWIDK